VSHYVTLKDAAWKQQFDLSGYRHVWIPVPNSAWIQQALSCKHELEVKLVDEDVVIFGLVRQLLRSQQQGHKMAQGQ